MKISPLTVAFAGLAVLLLGAAPAPDYQAMMKVMKIPGMVVLVMDHGTVVSDNAYGVKNLTSNAPVDEHTRFEIGSITKQFTAAAILRLKEKGKLALDDPLAKYLPQYTAARDVTLRQMLLQISGIPNYTDTKAFGKLIALRNGSCVVTEPGNVERVITMIKNQKLDFKPGTKWEYSNSNYYLLGRVVELASGEPWAQYISEHIFAPAGMTESSFMEDEGSVPDMATGYVYDKRRFVPAASFNGWAGGAGTIVSTASDLAKWDAALFAGKIIPPEDVKLMTSPGKLPALSGHYGFGWVIDTYDGQQRVWHNGGTLGFNASNQIYPAQRQAVIVLTNVAGGADAIADRTFSGLHPELAAAQNKPASGEDPAVTARAKTVWSEFVAGKLDRSQFTDAMNKAMTPQVISGAAAQFAPLGSATSWVYTGKHADGGGTTYAYHVTFANGASLNVYMTVDASNKIAGYLATPS